MNTPKWTPGEWRAEFHECGGYDNMTGAWGIGTERQEVARVDQSDYGQPHCEYDFRSLEAEANAHLFAASKDLYAALDSSNKLLALMYQELLALRATTDVPYCSFDVDVQRQAIENQAALQKAERRA